MSQLGGDSRQAYEYLIDIFDSAYRRLYRFALPPSGPDSGLASSSSGVAGEARGAEVAGAVTFGPIGGTVTATQKLRARFCKTPEPEMITEFAFRGPAVTPGYRAVEELVRAGFEQTAGGAGVFSGVDHPRDATHATDPAQPFQDAVALANEEEVEQLRESVSDSIAATLRSNQRGEGAVPGLAIESTTLTPFVLKDGRTPRPVRETLRQGGGLGNSEAPEDFSTPQLLDTDSRGAAQDIHQCTTLTKGVTFKEEPVLPSNESLAGPSAVAAPGQDLQASGSPIPVRPVVSIDAYPQTGPALAPLLPGRAEDQSETTAPKTPTAHDDGASASATIGIPPGRVQDAPAASSLLRADDPGWAKKQTPYRRRGSESDVQEDGE